MAAMASGDGPSGFSLEASLMMWLAGRPSSRATSSMGRPGWYTGTLRKAGLKGRGESILERVQNFLDIDIFGDQVTDEGDFLGVARPGLDCEIVNLGSDPVTVLSGEQHRDGHLPDHF